MDPYFAGKQKLWTRDFTIITIGSIVSMLGHAITGFAMSLLVLDYTESTLLYAVYMFMYTAPSIFAPIISGPLLDRFSRRRAIYTLDFITAGIYSLLGLMIASDSFSFPLLAVGCLIIGTINSIYTVAYQSLYPMLISEGNFTKAYSVSSTLETLTYVMVPVSTVLYKTIGMVPIMFIGAGAFLIAAITETQVVAKEEERYLNRTDSGSVTAHASLDRYRSDLKEGFGYLLSERGLFAIALYFLVSAFSSGVTQVLALPYFKDTFADGEYLYVFVWSFSMIGRCIGGAVHYRIKFPVAKKFSIALFVYITISVLEGAYLYCPTWAMAAMCFMTGILGVTSYNIRISSTQSYVPDDKKGRFNGIFLMMMTVGSLSGELTAGVLSEFMGPRLIISLVMVFVIAAAVVLIGGNRKHIAPIYNRRA